MQNHLYIAGKFINKIIDHTNALTVLSDSSFWDIYQRHIAV
jgi:hypothetical protein